MPRFPRRENEIIALSDEMIEGLKKHSRFFPNSDQDGMGKLRQAYQDRKDEQEEALNAYRAATEQKDRALMKLVRKMKHEIRQAELDAARDPDKLERIGWGGSSEVSVMPSPGVPRDLELRRNGAGRLVLNWRTPARGTGGPVRAYELQSRPADSPHATWTVVCLSFETTVAIDPPAGGLNLEYRVVARNQMGSSDPSNVTTLYPVEVE